jgi:Cu(I)/Ag(I) efflux system membrane fusion protein
MIMKDIIMKLTEKNKMRRFVFLLILVIIAFLFGFMLRGGGSEMAMKPEVHEHASGETQTQIWTCSMHPQIRMSHPGKCPICGMDLIPVISGDHAEKMGDRELKLSPLAMKLADIQTALVKREYVPVDIRMVGKVDYDETRLGNITAWVPGRLDRLYVDYTGISVRKGDHMVYLYSPELLTAQEELIQAVRAMDELKESEMRIMRETALRTVEASREKLRLWGLTGKQIAEIERSGKTSDHMTIYSPMGGVVIEKHVEEGEYVKTGTHLYTIADLSHLWIKLDAYESDLVWLRYGQEVHIETEAYPGELFKGTIAFIDPVLDMKTRTVKVRVNVTNPDGRLKPEMFVHTTVSARVAQSGRVMDEALAGKWICPMHPDVIKDAAGTCDICGMPLVRAETLGYASAAAEGEDMAPLVIPASAPLITGKRAVVYVAQAEKEGVFEGREIVLGPRAGDFYMVREGLNKGERVVVNGSFKIDSALQIQAKPSMMSPEGGAAPSGHALHGGMNMSAGGTKSEQKHEPAQGMKMGEKTGEEKIRAPQAFRSQLDDVLTVYFRIQEALSQDDAKGVQERAGALSKALGHVDMTLLTGPAHMSWMKDLKDLNTQASALKGTADIKKQRESFYLLSESITSVVKRFGTGGRDNVMQFFCPMAFDNRGAHWLQNRKEVRNPYFGKTMPGCGEQTATLANAMN